MNRCNVLTTNIHDFTETLLFMHSSQDAEKKIQLQAVSPHLVYNLLKLQHQKWQVCYWSKLVFPFVKGNDIDVADIAEDSKA